MIRTQNYLVDLAEQPIAQASEIETLYLEQISKLEAIDTELLKAIGYVNRFQQRWHGDRNFREQVSADPYKAVADYNLKINPEEIRPLWDTELTQRSEQDLSSFPLLKRCQELNESLSSKSLLTFIFTSFKDARFKKWRERQIARAASQFRQTVHSAIAQIPVCFELSKGCSIGCHFCGISAPRLTDIFIYNEENAKLWHEVLELMKEILGIAAGAGFCYWATEPFDNPDYEIFCLDFHKVLGVFPATTTAQALKDIERTKALLKLSREKGCLNNRFSVLSLKMLNQIHEKFSAEELIFVDLVLQNQEADTIKASAGKAREQNLKKGEEDKELPDQGTIACVTGFLFNMVDRSVKLISPCNANERWPLGYIVFDEGTFSDAKDLKILLERMIADNMPSTVREKDAIAFRRDLKYESLSDGFQLSNRIKTFKFRHESFLRELGEAIHKGGKNAEEIASMFAASGVSPDYTFYYLNLMFERGVLDDEPKPKSSQLKVPHYPSSSWQEREETSLVQSVK